MARSTTSATDLRTVLTVGHLYFAGKRQNEIARQLGLTNSTVCRALARAREFFEIRYTVPNDEALEANLLAKFDLSEAVVVETGHEDQTQQILGQTAARYFVVHVSSDDSVALSCGETLLGMITALPAQPSLRIDIAQLSVEGDPEFIHQAPATLAGLLRSKVSAESGVYGLQLPPLNIVPAERELRRQLRASPVMARLRKQALACSHVFVGVGGLQPQPRSVKHSFLELANRITQGEFGKKVERLRLVGEINNMVYDEAGNDRTPEISRLAEAFVNILSLGDLKAMASKPRRHRVIAVAAGRPKVSALRAALQSGIVNAVITSRETASRILEAA